MLGKVIKAKRQAEAKIAVTIADGSRRDFHCIIAVSDHGLRWH